MGVIFRKTQKGHAEITTKAGGLTPRVRRVLIFVDGKHTIEEMRAMLHHDDLTHTLGRLEEDGYIELAATTAEPGGAAAAPPPSPTAFAPLPDGSDALRLQQARNFMNNTLTTFVGPLGTSSLLERIENAAGHAQLRQLFDEWYHAIVSSREGRRTAEALRNQLLKVI